MTDRKMQKEFKRAINMRIFLSFFFLLLVFRPQ